MSKILSFAILMAVGKIFGCVAFCATGEEAPPAKPALYQQYHQITSTFWDAEHQLQQRVDPFSVDPSPYKSPLAETDSLYQKYFYVDQSAGDYVAALDRQKKQSWTLPPVLYLGGIAAFTIGDYSDAEKYFSRILKNYPNYQRNTYINDRYAPDPDFAQPVKPAVTKLLFYCQIVEEHGNTNHASDGMAAFRQFNKTSIKVLSTQAAFAKWLAHRPYKSQRRNFFNEDYGDEQPDQCRASVLPQTAKLIKEGWQRLFPLALKKGGALAMRKYLRTLMTDNSSLHDIAAPRLAEVDQLVIKSYFAQAKVLLRKHDFAGTRKMYSKLISEYSGTDAARKAEIELQNVTPISVRYYKRQGDINFHPEAKIGVPQNKAATFYEKMYKADDSGPLADVALYYWARALSTEGKAKQTVRLLEQHLVKFPKSKTRAKAMYLLGFTYVDHQLRNYKKGVPLLLQVAKDFPHDADAPEALWAASFVLGWNQQFAQAIPLLQQLKKQYPKSLRAKYADQWIAKYQEVMQSGATWP